MKKIILGIMVFGFVGLVCGSARGQIAENIIKLKKSGNCKGCFLKKANLEGANLEGADLKGANLKGLNPKKANLKGANLEGANLKGANLEGANLKGVNLKGADLKGVNLKGVNLEKANLKGTNLEFDDKNFYRLSVGKADREKGKIKGAKNQKKVKGAKKTTKVSQKDLVRMCKRKAEAQFRKCAKGSTGGNVGGNFLAHQGCKKQRKKDMLACESPR